MTGLYLFAAAVGIPLVLWFLLSGGDEGGEDGGGAGDGMASVMLRLLPLNSLALAAATFGVAGLALGAVGTGGGLTFAAAAGSGAAAGALNSTVFGLLRRTESASEVSDDALAGSIGRVVLPIAEGGRGRVAISVGGQQVYLSARALPDAVDRLEAGASVLVVDVQGGIARVTPLDPELT
jgi:membrane protein implicated in regulation of membrane protease activity